MLAWILKPLAYASTLAFTTLGLLSPRSQTARFYFNFTLYLSILGASSVWGVLISIFATIAGRVRLR
jgi:lysophosphatidate acyltransferase